MIALVTILSAFALGWFVPARWAAYLAYAVLYLWAFTFQTLYLLLDSLGGGKDPAFAAGQFPLSYGLVTAGICLVGFGLVTAGARLRRRAGTVATAPAQRPV